MRSWSSSHGVNSGAEPGVTAWSPARQRSTTDLFRRDWQQPNGLPPRPAAPPATAPTPGMAATLAPPQLYVDSISGPASNG